MTNDGEGKNNTGTGQAEDVGRADLRGPWTPAEEEVITLLMELMPLLAEANEVARRRRYRKEARAEDGAGLERSD